VIVAMEARHVPAVVGIHLASFPNDFITRLGRRYLAEVFYPGFIGAPQGVGLVWEQEGVQGFVVGSTNYKRFYRAVVGRQRLRLLAALAGEVLRHPRHLLRVLAVSRLVLGGPRPPFEGDLAYIAAAPQTQGRGIGKALVAEFLARLEAAGASGCWTKTREENRAARALYERGGFRVHERFYSDGGWWLLYGCPLGAAAREDSLAG